MPVKLRPEPQRLLEQLIAAENATTERQMFVVYRWEGDGKVVVAIGHPGFPNNLLSPVFEGDIEVLLHAGLLLRSTDGRQLGVMNVN